MLIYDQTKTRIIENPDLEKGRLVEDFIITKYHNYSPAVKEQGHYELDKEYRNGGKEWKWVIDVPASPEKEAYNETENILVYIEYSDLELAQNKINKLKRKLNETDYKAIKYAEGAISEQEYSPIKMQRQNWRNEINGLMDKYNISEDNK
jgi:hypothetical protein